MLVWPVTGRSGVVFTADRFCLVACLFQAEDGIRDLVRSRGLGDVYKRQLYHRASDAARLIVAAGEKGWKTRVTFEHVRPLSNCLLYTSDAADDSLCLDLGGRRIIKKKTILYIVSTNISPLIYNLSIHTKITTTPTRPTYSINPIP